MDHIRGSMAWVLGMEREIERGARRRRERERERGSLGFGVNEG